MDIQEKQARWALEQPLFEAEFIHSHLLPFFNFNENTGDYEIKSEFSEDEDQKVAYETLNTGWVMWLRAKRAKAQSVPYEPGSFKSSHEIIINETKSELIDGYDIAKEDEYLLESLVYRGVCIGKAQAVPEGFVLVKNVHPDAIVHNQGPGLFKECQVIYGWGGKSKDFKDALNKGFYHGVKLGAKAVLETAMIEIQEQSHESK